ncbi:MAG TPA: hypothetical protein VEU96_23470 [Bryobacteraceae bacterium]|nr:hypothetical protein [Bryobacteraceae bacterium]
MLLYRSFAVLAFCAALYGADTKDVSKTLALNPTGLVTLDTLRGSIDVATWDRPEVEIKARIEAAGSSSMDIRRFDRTDVSIDSAPDSVRIRSNYPSGACCSWNTGENPDIRYTIRMPRTARLTIRDHRSNTDIRDLAGALDLDTHRGTVRVAFAAFTANSRVETHRGTVELLLPRDSRFNLETNLDRKASIDSDFQVLAHISGRRGPVLEGAVNGGGPALRLITHRGRIHLRGQ